MMNVRSLEPQKGKMARVLSANDGWSCERFLKGRPPPQAQPLFFYTERTERVRAKNTLQFSGMGKKFLSLAFLNWEWDENKGTSTYDNNLFL